MIHIVTVATESRYYLPYLYDTCERFGYTLNVLGFNEKWSGYVFKLEKMIEFLRNVDPQDIVCFRWIRCYLYTQLERVGPHIP